MSHGRHDPVQRVTDKHADELLDVARTLGGHAEATSARAAQIDRYGIDLVLTTPTGPAQTRVDFAQPVSDPKWMRARVPGSDPAGPCRTRCRHWRNHPEMSGHHGR